MQIKRYNDFLSTKEMHHENHGIDVPADDISPVLFDFQRDIVKWALSKGRAAVFADCGMGKTLIQLEWARHIFSLEGKPVLIVAPLAVSRQTKREGEKLGIEVTICRSQADVIDGINITNYEMLDHFEAEVFSAVVLDESSILKNYTGKRKRQIMAMFRDTPYKLACTATPSPNDHMEILNHAEFLNVMKSHEALSIWFINDTMNSGKYRLKNHAVADFWRWVSSWAVSISKPSDLGYEDGRFILPELRTHEHIVDVDLTESAGGQLFRTPALSATDYHQEKRLTATDRALAAADIVNGSDEILCIWCETNYEADALMKYIPDAVEVRGDHSQERKEQAAVDFISGNIRVLISKPSIFGFGLNFQVCHNVIFCGLSYSYESYYQATRRFWRFGQERPVDVHVILGSTEMEILSVIRQKEEHYHELKSNMQSAIRQFQHINNRGVKYRMDYEKRMEQGGSWTMILGDAVEEIKDIDSESIGFEIFSPPFSNLYIYSDSYRDMGNNRNDDEFFLHFGYLIPELYRILKTGRLCAVHCKQLVNYKNRDGASGLRDFRGDIIRHFTAHGFVYHSEVCIWKDPVIEMQRTKSHGLLYKQLRKDSSYSRQGLPDYLVVFRKWGDEDADPVDYKTHENFPLEIWQRYASPVWFDIQQTNVLNCKLAREGGDEKHICPLQLDVIDRAIELWTKPGDAVFSPFAGIGSEGYCAVKAGRRFVGIELKEGYFNEAVRNLREAEELNSTADLFSGVMA